ncbi:hypothetical protein FWD07_00580 [Candidatus Saccharibacteria bacterium]|nr:hypothetical protein [Candidatus Saccharibacteria bacterium]
MNNLQGFLNKTVGYSGRMPDKSVIPNFHSQVLRIISRMILGTKKEQAKFTETENASRQLKIRIVMMYYSEKDKTMEADVIAERLDCDRRIIKETLSLLQTQIMLPGRLLDILTSYNDRFISTDIELIKKLQHHNPPAIPFTN